MKQNWNRIVVLFVIVSLILGGCVKKNTTAPGAGGAKNASNMNIGLVTDVGGVNDKSFNQSAWEALQKLNKDTGVKVKYLQSKGDTDYIPNLNQFVKAGYNLTWGIGFTLADALKTVAQQNPNAKLGIIDNVVDAPNVKSVTFAEQEGSYLVGVIAGLMTKTGKVGFVGGMEIPVVKHFEAGFNAGVQAANPNVKVLVNYTGAFDKPDLGKSAAATMYNNGVDIIFHASGATGNGVFNEAKDRKKSGQNVWVIGVDKDQSVEFGNDITLTSMMKYVDQAVYQVSKQIVDSGTFDNKPVTLGLKDNGVGLPPNNPNVPEDVMAKVSEFKDKIVSGQITVPDK